MFNSAKLLFNVRIKDYMDFVLDNQIVLVILISGLLITEVILTRRFATVIFGCTWVRFSIALTWKMI